MLRSGRDIWRTSGFDDCPDFPVITGNGDERFDRLVRVCVCAHFGVECFECSTFFD